MGRPKKYEFPKNMTYDRANERYVVRNPLNDHIRRFAKEADALKTVNVLNEWLEVQRQKDALTAGRPCVSGLVEKWIEDRLQFMPWDAGTKQNYLAKFKRIKRELGERTIVHTDAMFLEEWIASFSRTADTFNDWRYVFSLLWRYAVSRSLAKENEGEKVEPRSTSKKIEANQKVRQPLDLAGFKDIHEKCEPWLQLAMEESLVTLQARLEICNMRHDHHRDGHLYVIRDKVSGDSDMAFIKIALTEQLLELQKRAIKLDDAASPYLVHRKPANNHRKRDSGKPHWTYINGDYLTKAFLHARDQVDRFKTMEPGERPTFHEIRGLGSRIYLAQGMSKAAIKALMTHTHERTTQIYLEGGAQALTDADYQPVVAPLVLRDVL